MRTVLTTVVLGFALTSSLLAHRVEGLLQASLVELLPAQVGVEVTLIPGIDIAPKFVRLLDANSDGIVSAAESAEWSAQFMAGQQVLVDGHPLPLKLADLHMSPVSEMGDGHAEIVVHYTAELGALNRGSRVITCINRYEPISTAYQSHGLVPKAPGLTVLSHRRDERQQELTLNANFPSAANRETPSPSSATEVQTSWFGLGPALPWLLGLNLAGGALILLAEHRQRTGKARHQQMT
jgi:hypothetical protein